MKLYRISKICRMSGTNRRYWWLVADENGNNVAHCLFESKRAALHEVEYQKSIDARVKEALS